MIPKITIEPVENTVEIQIEEFTRLKEPSLNKLSEFNPVDSYDLTNKVNAIDMKKEQKLDKDIQQVLQWLKSNKRPNVEYSSYDLQKYHKQFGRLIVDNGLLCRKFFDHTGKNYIKQFVVPKQLQTELIYRIHNSKMKGHIGIQKTIREFRRKYYFPGFIEFLIQYINDSLTCLQAKSPKHQELQPHLSPVSSNTSMPADMLQIDIVGPLPKSGGFSYILTRMDVFTKYMFAQPLTSISAETVCKDLMQWFMRHSYIYPL